MMSCFAKARFALQIDAVFVEALFQHRPDAPDELEVIVFNALSASSADRMQVSTKLFDFRILFSRFSLEA